MPRREVPYVMRLRIEMQANVHNLGSAKIRDGRLTWHLYTDMDNQYVDAIDVFPPARVFEKAERNMVAVIKVPELSPGESFSPTVILRMDTTTRDWMIEPRRVPDQVKKRIRGTFSSMQKYWEIDNPAVQELSQRIAESSKSDDLYARIAAKAVRERVKLKTHLEERRGAARAAIEKEGDCDEHADLFIALTRAVGIPSRRVTGHIYRGGPEPEPHAWCEVFLDSVGWVPVDPALDRFGMLTEQYFSRIREGLVSERPSIQLKYTRVHSESVAIEEHVRMSVFSNG
ncbi:MAG: transglutaminase domain-containing protein [Candidatus Thorarchaeota archaeon]|nr:transglutaminase domain-containing protein [Candidatus Thorarchaeota archaeon]